MQKIFFISDVHLSLIVKERELNRRAELYDLLDEVKAQQAILVIVGDFFDFYFEWGAVITQAYQDVYTKLAELRAAGIEIHYFAGNHDFYLGDFLSKDLDIKIYQDATTLRFGDKNFYCIHGDGLAATDGGYRRFKRFIRSRFSVFMFRWLIHPNIGHWLAKQVSYTSRTLTRESEAGKHALIDENLEFAKQKFAEGADYVVTGHIHLPRLDKVGDNAFLTIGDFLQYFSYGYYDGVNLSLKQWPVKSLPQRLIA